MKKNSFRTLLEEFDTVKKQLSEDYFGMNDEMPMGEPMAHEEEMVQDPRMHQDSENDKEDEIAMHAQDIIKKEPIIARIRETAIEGLKKYSDNPTSSIYEFMKKVFLEADKVLTNTEKK